MSLKNIMSSPQFNKSTYILAANRSIRRQRDYRLVNRKPIVTKLVTDAKYSKISAAESERAQVAKEKAAKEKAEAADWKKRRTQVWDGLINADWDGHYIPGMTDNGALYQGMKTSYGTVIRSELVVMFKADATEFFQPTLELKNWLLDGLFGANRANGYEPAYNIYKTTPSLQIVLSEGTRNIDLQIKFDTQTISYGPDENTVFTYQHTAVSPNHGLLSMTGAFKGRDSGELRFFLDGDENDVTDDVILAGDGDSPYAAVYVTQEGGSIILLMPDHMVKKSRKKEG